MARSSISEFTHLPFPVTLTWFHGITFPIWEDAFEVPVLCGGIAASPHAPRGISLASQKSQLPRLVQLHFTYLMSRDGDLEAQRELSQSHRASSRYYLLGWKVLMVLGKGLGEGEIHEMTIRPPETSSDASRASAFLAQPVVSQAIGAAFIPLSATYQVDILINTRR